MWRNFSDILAWCTSLEQLTCGFSLLFSLLRISKVAFLLFFIRSSQNLLDKFFPIPAKKRTLVICACRQAFDELKKRLVSASLLADFHPEWPSMLETDASDGVIAGGFPRSNRTENSTLLHTIQRS